MQDWNLTDQIARLENAGLENDELRLKQPPTSSTSELSQNCVGLLHEVVDVHVHFCSKVAYCTTVLRQQFCRIDLSAETSP